MSYCTLTCKCGHVADLGEFCRTVIYGELPPGNYQCPGCGFAWVRKESEYRILRSGSAAMVIPGKVEMVQIAGRL
jgi:hypothetical protein